MPTPLSQIIPNASHEAVVLMTDLLKYDPQQRPTCSQTLQYPYFQVNAAIAPPPNLAQPQASTFTRRPVQETEHEQRIKEAALEKQVRFTGHNPLVWCSGHRASLDCSLRFGV
ncbi:MAK [Symbiodinium microadriaticum]|nr:MAK [Symbiodinium microadriaticum]